MNSKICIFVITLFISFSAFSQPALTEEQLFTELSKSIVWVEVSNIPGKDNNVCTGFVWQNPNQVVTSLHAMNPSGRIWIKYFNNSRYLREVVVKKIFKDGDLVLLEVKPGQLDIPPGVVPLKDVNTAHLDAGTQVYTLGYHSGAVNGQSRFLKKGYVVPPETLENFLPRPYTVILKSHKFPRVDIDIIYLDGSLLPGYSGAPCVDKSGRLVGVGDGGLEKGASNVSWIIPSKFLTELGASVDSELPFGFATDLHFCTTIPGRKSTLEEEYRALMVNSEASDAPGINIYDPVTSDDFEFHLTKNRSLMEMYETTDNPDNLINFLAAMKDKFKVKMDYENMRFDIYEDINYGVVLAVPEGEELFFNEQANHFQVNKEENTNVNLLFEGVAADFSKSTIEDVLDANMEWLLDSMYVYWNVKSFRIDNEYTYLLPYDRGRNIAYVLMKSEPVADDEFGGFSTIYLYVTLLLSEEKSFMSVASFKMADEKLKAAEQEGLDCLNDDIPNKDCEYFKSLIKVFSAAHLTTFAYIKP